MPRPPAVCALFVALFLAVACSSSKTASSSDTSTPAATASTDTTPPPTTSAAAPTTVAAGSAHGQGVLPAVANATSLNAAPAVAAGSGAPPQSLVIRELVLGKGAVATGTSTVNVQYVGANYADGQVFDSSWQRGQPASFPLSRVIPGFAQGIRGMRVGGRRELVIPPALGYGKTGSGPVGPNETLVFVIDLLGVQ